MSEVAENSAAATGPVASGGAELSAGAMLRRAREAAGLHIGALAVTMKIPVKKLEALESDQLDQLPDAVFVRALASSVCRTLHIDAAPILQKLPSTKAPQLQSDERGLNAPFRGSGEVRTLALRPLLTSPAALIVMALLLGALAVYLFPEIRYRETPSEAAVASKQEAESSEPVAAAAPGVVMPAASADAKPTATVVTPQLPSPAPEQVAPAPSSVASPTAAASAAPPSKPVVAASAAPAAVQPSSSASTVPVLPTDGIVVFKARGTTWVKVVDAKATVLLSKTLGAGEQVGVSGSLPLSVIVGRSDLTEVQVRGQPFAIQDLSKDNVARFEVK